MGWNWKFHVIIVIKTDLSGFAVTMHSGLCQQHVGRAKAFGIWLPVSHAPSCIVTTPSRTGFYPLIKVHVNETFLYNSLWISFAYLMPVLHRIMMQVGITHKWTVVCILANIHADLLTYSRISSHTSDGCEQGESSVRYIMKNRWDWQIKNASFNIKVKRNIRTENIQWCVMNKNWNWCYGRE